MPTSGEVQEKLLQALLSAYDRATLVRLVRFRLNEDLDAITEPGSLSKVVTELIAWALREGRLEELIQQARNRNPGNPDLKAFWQWYISSNPTQPQREMERIVRRGNPLLDVVQWRTRLAALEAQVCRIEIPDDLDTTYGTGFLVGPDLVLTNYHVMASVIRDPTLAPSVTLLFDYKQLDDGKTLNSGCKYGLAAADWLVDQSPPSEADLLVTPQDQLPGEDELDYALLRLEAEIGSRPVDSRRQEENPPPPLRGWIKMSSDLYPFTADSPLLILQHPDAAPLKLALDMDAILNVDTTGKGLNGNGTRVRYRTNTEGGSSGSPCFNHKWDLVALHHSGDPNFAETHRPQYNEGIPITGVIGSLRRRGFGDQLPP
jgi:hypothetical protein